MEDINTQNVEKIFEEEVLSHLINDEKYFKSVIPYLKPSYFSKPGTSELFSTIKEIYLEYGNTPSLKDIIISVKDLPKRVKDEVVPVLKEVSSSDKRINYDLLIKKTEEFISRSIHTEALLLGAEAMGEDNKDKLLESFRLSEEALKVSLDEDFGTNIDQIEEAIDTYQDDEIQLLTGIDSFDYMVGKGYKTKTLHTFLAPPGIGKSATMAAYASQFLKQKKDIVVFSLEMDEFEWLKRVYANIVDIPITDLENISKTVILEKWNSIKGDLGTLTIKEYPSFTASALTIENFLDKYAAKTGINNPIVFVDYLGLMNSSRLAANTPPYEYIKSITAELRSIAQKLDIVIFTAHQLNRSAIGNLEAGQEAVSDSAGISMFSDSMIFLLQTKEMKELGELVVNFEKNRMSGKTTSFKIGFDYSKMRFVDRFIDPNTRDKVQKFRENSGSISTGLETGLSLGKAGSEEENFIKSVDSISDLDSLLDDF